VKEERKREREKKPLRHVERGDEPAGTAAAVDALKGKR
jgi:hypothetical protein